jgi:ParB-like chromosome segregation protein Spo0J
MRDTRTESVLSSLKVRFDYQAEFPLVNLGSDDVTQVRLPENRMRPPEVKRYKDLLAAGAEFPPVVADKTGRIIDGNTRWAAYEQGRRTAIPAYICDISSPALARRIGVELNAVHGKRMEREELTAWLAAGNGSVSEDDARRLTGWSAEVVRRVRAAVQFDSRRAALGISLTSVLPDTIKAVLNRVTNPDVFADLTRLADEAGLNASEVRALVSQANTTALTDVAAARNLISESRADNRPRIEERRAGLRVSTPLYHQLSMHLGWIIKQGSPGLFDANVHTGAKSQELIREALDVLKDALRRYE